MHARLELVSSAEDPKRRPRKREFVRLLPSVVHLRDRVLKLYPLGIRRSCGSHGLQGSNPWARHRQDRGSNARSAADSCRRERRAANGSVPASKVRCPCPRADTRTISTQFPFRAARQCSRGAFSLHFSAQGAGTVGSVTGPFSVPVPVRNPVAPILQLRRRECPARRHSAEGGPRSQPSASVTPRRHRGFRWMGDHWPHCAR